MHRPWGNHVALIKAMGEETETRARGTQKVIGERLGFRLAALAAAWLVLAVAPCSAVVRHPALARKAWLHAERLQKDLSAKPSTKRTAAEYKRVIREYRRVYYYDFAYVKAPVAAQTMADLYEEMGTRFQDPAYFNLAIKYYRYVVTEYPGTSMARDSALAVGKVYLDDLHDTGQAAEAYRAFLKKHPRSSKSAEARSKLKEIADLQAASNKPKAAAADSTEAASETGHSSHSGPVEVTEIHKWVGPNFTRVVIGAKGAFQYNTLRLSNPDRIVFDLPNTHVRPTLRNKSVAINGAFLRDIRVGQFKPNVTRIVLDVRDISDYSAFAVPNPFRLIIDVRGEPAETASKSPEHRAADSPATAKPVLTEQASIARSKPLAAPPRHVERLEEPKPGPAIEFQDQMAAKTKAETEAKQDAGKAARLNTKAEPSQHVSQAAPPTKAAPAIEFHDQQAVKTKATATAKQGADEAAKQKTKTTPVTQARPTAKAKADADASHPNVQETRKAKDEVASVNHRQEEALPTVEANPGHKTRKSAGSKAEEAALHQVLHATKRKAELASSKSGGRVVRLSTKPASPTENGSQTLTRALGLKVARIVIDPGHGGFDTGTIGPSGLEEKNLVLDIGLRLRKLLETRTNSEVFMTRSTDKFIPLEERTAIANEDGADLFVSIHANASSDHHVRGIETYFLNFTRDPEALRLAARENATSQESVHQLQNLIKKIALNNKIEESQELARDIQTALYKHMSRVSRGIHNRGVRKAPFVVLIGAQMPSILAEISFLSNAHSERLLRTGSYREQIAKALFNGIEDYITNLGSVRVAQRTR